MSGLKLDRRITFRRATLVDDGYGMVETWADHGTPVWASMHHASDAEKWRAAQVQATISTRFKVRYSAFTADITPKDRLVFEGAEYDITAAKEVDGRRRWVEISGVARADA